MNSALPIVAFKDQILDAIQNNSVVIITAETGAGKSTQVPQLLLDAGYSILVTEPRILATRTVSERVAIEYGCELGEEVGYKTSRCEQYSDVTRCLFVTDGLAMVREILGYRHQQILVIDEVHEWNKNVETLVAWAKFQISNGADFKVVLMSATLEAERLQAFFDGAPIIKVPGRLYPVEEVPASVGDPAYQADILLREGKNVLLFMPGKPEIADAVFKLQQSRVVAEIIPLHGELEPGDQLKAFCSYNRPKCVVATNVAQTSVTVPDIDAVVDSGLEKRVEIVDGVEGLYLRPISVADREQRRGRAGRTKPGVYIDMCPATDEVRGQFPKAEILRTRIDQTALHLAIAGIDMEELSFFHQPDKVEIHEAKRALVALGCLKSNGYVTDMGYKIARLPISVQYARMIIEAERLGVVDDVVTITAILEVGDITERPMADFSVPKWKSLVPSENQSDALAQLVVYKSAMGRDKNWHTDHGIFRPKFFKVRELREQLIQALKDRGIRTYSSGNREAILKSICAGMVDHVYQNSYGFLKNGEGSKERRLNRGSVVSLSNKWIVGRPLDIEFETRHGRMPLHLLRMATAIDVSWLVEIAPQLVTVEYVDPQYDPQTDVCTSLCRTKFNNQVISEVREATPDHPEAQQKFVNWLTGPYCLDRVMMVNRDLRNKAEYESNRLGRQVHKVYSQGEYVQFLLEKLGSARSFRELGDKSVLSLPQVSISDELMRVLCDSDQRLRPILTNLGYNPPVTASTSQYEKDKVEAPKLQAQAKELYSSSRRFGRGEKEKLHKFGYQYCPTNSPSDLRKWVEDASKLLANLRP